MDPRRLDIHVGEPAALLPYLPHSDVLIADVAADHAGDLHAILEGWASCASRLLLVVPGNKNPTPYLAAAGKGFVGFGLVHVTGLRTRSGVENVGFGLYVFGRAMPVSSAAPRQPMYFRVWGGQRSWDEVRAHVARAVIEGAVAPHESVLDPFGDDFVWGRTAAIVGRHVTVIAREQAVANDLRHMPRKRLLFSDGGDDAGFETDPYLEDLSPDLGEP